MRSSRVFDDLPAGGITPFIGVYDAFSASLAARRFEHLFLSGFGFAASYYGLPDVGFVTWSDMLTYVARIRAAVPGPRLLVDIDDGYVDVDVAVHTARQLEALGAWGVVLEDQQRPRRCGHFDGKRILPAEDYIEKLEQVLEARQDLVVVARTDSSDPSDALDRIAAYAAAGADAVLIDGVRDLSVLREARERAGVPVVFNQIAGGKSPQCSLEDLRTSGVSMAIYSTPCLFAAQRAMEDALDQIATGDGALSGPESGAIGVKDCTAILDANLPAATETT